MEKQTAVEWLIEQMHKNIEWIPIPMQEQAKEMEKQMTIDAYLAGYSATENQGDSEQYYNETYKKNK
jgi:hypothetical protein